MNSPYFPWRLYRKFFFALLILLNVCFVGSMLLGFGLFDIQLPRSQAVEIFGCFIVVATLGAAILSYQFASPFRRLIIKALRIASKKLVADVPEMNDEDPFLSEPGEYVELEQALEKIRKKLKKRRLELAHEREESQTLMTFLEDAVVSLNREGKIQFYNSRFATLFIRPELLKSQDGNQWSLTTVFRDPELLKMVATTLESGAVARFQQKMPTILEPPGRYFSIAVSPLREEKSREVYGAMLLFHDISEIKKAEQIRIEFVENASHELRSPLTSIKGFLETAREDLAEGRPEMVPQFLGTISKSVDRLSDLVNDMLTITSLENRNGLNLELIHPEMLTQEVFERLAQQASDRRIMLKLVDESAAFKADYVMMERVLENLVGNAIKYIHEGGQIEVRWQLDRPNKKLILHVKDNGPGIAEEHLDRLFERFYRIDKGRSRDVGGTGLGLSIVKHIVQSHGGAIRVQSKLGQGADFICELPFRC